MLVILLSPDKALTFNLTRYSLVSSAPSHLPLTRKEPVSIPNGDYSLEEFVSKGQVYKNGILLERFEVWGVFIGWIELLFNKFIR